VTRFLVRRFVQSVVVVFGVLVITFILVHLLPGSPAKAELGPKATSVAIAQFNKTNGLDHPLIVQFWIYLTRVARGNLGFSYIQNQTVASLVAQNLPKDAILIVISTILSLVVAIPLGIYQAIRRNTIGDYVMTGFSFIFYSMPIFLLGFLLIVLFSIQFHVFPAEAPQTSSAVAILEQPRALVLPVVSLALITIASFSRYIRSSGIENLAQDFIRTARAKGLPQRLVVTRHLLRNSLMPIVTLLGLSLPFIVGGALITEQVFNYPGMGLVFFKAAEDQDYAILIGFTIFIGIATVVGNLLADIAYGLLDPRIRVGAS
jgi:peptide/nickel transport system permease protein